MGNKYRVLKAIGTIYKILGWLVLILGILGSIGGCLFAILGSSSLANTISSSGASSSATTAQLSQLGFLTGTGGIITGILIAFGGLIGSILYAALLIAAGQLIDLLIDLSTSSQQTAELMTRMVNLPRQ